MKRALAILAALSVFGFAGMAQFSGEWSTTLNILPTLGLEESVLTLKYEVAGWTLTGISTFDPAFSEQKFEVAGTLGAFAIEGWMLFDPTSPAYAGSYLQAKLDFAGVTFTSEVYHVGPGYIALIIPSAYQAYITVGPALLYLLNIDSEVVDVDVTFYDVCTGAEFGDITISFDDISLCCGITYDFEVYFTKDLGFEYAEFSFSDLFSLCCGISFDASVKFGVNYKTVSLTPSIDLGAECLTLGLDVGWSNFTVTGIDIDYIGISCEYGDCLKAEFGTAFLREWNIIWQYGTQTGAATIWTLTAPSAWGLKNSLFAKTDSTWVFATYSISGSTVTITLPEGTTDAIAAIEYEYAKFSFCGPACCGGQYTVDVSLYWANFYDIFEDGNIQVPPVQVFPTLFGLDRVVGSFSVPIMDNLSISIDLTHWLLPGITELDIGWTFTF